MSVPTMKVGPRLACLGLALLALVALLSGSALTGSRAWGADSVPTTAVTVPGPASAPGSTITVSQTVDLVNQIVHVSWTGFKPSSPIGVVSQSTTNPVRIYQCKASTTDPKTVSGPGDCYGNENNGLDPPNNPLEGAPEGPSNAQDVSTQANGTAGSDFEVRNSLNSNLLGCGPTQPCAIVVVPNWTDTPGPYTYDSAEAWADHVVIPISFLPLPTACGVSNADLRGQGSALALRAIAQWQPALCKASPAVNVNFGEASETTAVNEYLSGGLDLAVTIRPASAAKRPTVYAPTANSALVVAFLNDDAVSKTEIRSMKLNARLLAKLITQSYGYSVGSPAGADYGDPAVRGNPYNLFYDPEFLALNPGVNWNANALPIIRDSDVSDLTYELTRYIASDPDAVSFLEGKPDPWGMVVNRNYKLPITYPIDAFQQVDPYPDWSYFDQPVQPFTAIGNAMVFATQPGAQAIANPLGGHDKFTPEPVGGRSLIAIMDEGTAAAYNLPVASLKNAAGAYVTPDAQGMAAALGDMKVNADGVTAQVDFTKKDPAAYPLTMTSYMMAPTSGLNATKASKLAEVLGLTGGSGQTPGIQPGQLPVGYLPLTASQVAQVKAAQAAVLAQKGGGTADAPPNPGSSTPAGASDLQAAPQDGGTTGFEATSTGDDGAPAGGDATPASSATPSPSGAPTLSPTLVARGVRAPGVADNSGFAGVVLPLILALGLLAAVVGPLAYVLATDGLPSWMGRRPRRSRVRSKPPTTPPNP